MSMNRYYVNGLMTMQPKLTNFKEEFYNGSNTGL